MLLKQIFGSIPTIFLPQTTFRDFCHSSGIYESETAIISNMGPDYDTTHVVASKLTPVRKNAAHRRRSGRGNGRHVGLDVELPVYLARPKRRVIYCF